MPTRVVSGDDRCESPYDSEGVPMDEDKDDSMGPSPLAAPLAGLIAQRCLVVSKVDIGGTAGRPVVVEFLAWDRPGIVELGRA